MNDVTVIPANAVATWDPNSGAPLPAYLADFQNEMGSNIPDRMTVPSLSYEGKVWQIVKAGNRSKLQATNADGDVIPIPVMRMVILNFNANRGRAYYPGTYNPAAVAAPVCWSPDGIAPDASVKEKQSPTCNNCPMAVKGSKVDSGREMVACSQHRMVAVVPAFDITSEPLRLKIAVTSDYDKEIKEHGWFAFRQYTDFLKSRGLAHTGLVVTKVKFDDSEAYPKLLFALDRALSPDEIQQVRAAMENPKIGELLAEKWTPAGVNGTPINDADIDPNVTPAAEQTIDATAQHVAQPHTPPPGKPKPTDPTHIAHAGTENEVWWDGEAWVRPWDVKVPEPVAPPPAPEPVATVDPLALAIADGWLAHPDAPGYHYKGQEVVADDDLRARYPSAAPATPQAPAGSLEVVQTAAPDTASTSTTATSAASPSDASAVPADVQALLNKWGGNG